MERGTHGALLAAEGRYARMWRLQLQEKAAQQEPVEEVTSRSQG